jgi:hypothetical protein
MRTLFLFLLFSPVFASLTINDIKQHLKQGAGEDIIVPLIQKEGIGFPVNLKHLKKMKKAGFPDYLIDTLVELYGPHKNNYHTGTSASLSYESSCYPRYYSPFYEHFPFSWFNPSLCFSTWNGYGFWNYYSSIYPYFWGLGYGGYYWGYYYGQPANPGNRLTPWGFANQHDSRVRGQATHRTKRRTKTRNFFSGSSSGGRTHSGSSGSRSASSPRSSGSHAVRK